MSVPATTDQGPGPGGSSGAGGGGGRSRVPVGFLHLQLGQEIIYLMLAASLAAAFVMASLLAAQRELARQTPPIITLSEAEGFYFASGSTVLSDDFRELLIQEVIPRVVDASQEYGATVVEVVGHTDESPIRTGESNLDDRLLPFLAGEPGEPLRAADNAGLGLARAAAVAQVIIAQPEAAGLSVLPLSGAQAAEPGDKLATEGGPLAEQSRRRIEIRLRRPVPREIAAADSTDE